VNIEYTDLINMTSSNTVDILYDIFESSTIAGLEYSELDE